MKRPQPLPDTPGVYKFIGSRREILYVGKAASLRNRVKSYFSKDLTEKRSPLIARMIAEAEKVAIEKTDSVLEALILEAKLIKELQPKYNTAQKDQRSWNWIVITDESFPRILLVRERIIHNSKFLIHSAFGPFTNGGQLKEALKIIRKIFPFRDKCNLNQGRPCFNHQLGLCPGVCVSAISENDYKKTIRHIKTFFEGKKISLIKNLEKEMRFLSKEKEFEKAAEIKKKIFALKHINDVALIKDQKFQAPSTKFQTLRIEAYDVAHISGKEMVGAMAVVEDGETKKSEYRMFKIKNQDKVDDIRALKEILERRLKHAEWPSPDLIVVDGGVAQLNATENMLKNSKTGKFKNLQIVAVTKDEKHKPAKILKIKRFKDLRIKNLEKGILLANSEAHRFAVAFHRKLRSKIFK